MPLTVQGLLSNEELRLHEFPVAARKVFLAHAAVSPLPRRVAEAMAEASKAGMSDDQEAVVGYEVIHQTRQRAAELLGAATEEIALVGPTSLALSFVAGGLPLRRGDNIVVYFDDYPANVYPWMTLAEKGVQVRFLNTRGLGRIRPVDVMGQVDESTRLVALASCHFVSGWRVEIEALGRQLRERGIWFCVDAIQTLGAFPLKVANSVDFLAADAHKWLLGPSGAGLLYVRRECQGLLRPIVFGWHNVRCPDFIAQEKMEFRPDARRYEVGTVNLAGIVGLNAALGLLLELGVENIAAELLRKRAWLVPELLRAGWQVLHADASEVNAGGILTLSRDDTNLAEWHARLAREGFVTSLRADRSRRQYLRLSPHFYNTDTELQRLVEILKA
ncbi:MAG: aminotransferase class V-fold PLP-dependent enzyme [Verrucomicrobiae bacterium]|nr:aminotransferase class V-fold PLP-dependent enzyme [Verrucomicrobiae bacterium]